MISAVHAARPWPGRPLPVRESTGLHQGGITAAAPLDAAASVASGAGS